MSAAAAIDRLMRAIDAKLGRITPFRATVDTVSGGLVTLIPATATDATTATYPTLGRQLLAPGDEVLVINVNGDWIVADRIRRAAAASPVVAAQTAAGNTATTAGQTAGTDTCGLIELIPGGTGIASGSQVLVTFAAARPSSGYRVTLTPLTSAARAANTIVGVTGRTTTTWQITADSALSSGQTYRWFYSVEQFSNS